MSDEERGEPADRRRFLREAVARAVEAGGTVARAASRPAAGLAAAGDAVVAELEALGAGQGTGPGDADGRPAEGPPGGVPGVPATVPQEPTPPSTPGPAAPIASAPSAVDAAPASTARAPAAIAPARSVPLPPASPTEAQAAILAVARSGVLGTVDGSGAPRLTTAEVTWDGSSLGVAGRSGTARVNDVLARPAVSVLLDDPASDAYLVVTGVAAVRYGEADSVVLDVRPTRFLLARRRP